MCSVWDAAATGGSSAAVYGRTDAFDGRIDAVYTCRGNAAVYSCSGCAYGCKRLLAMPAKRLSRAALSRLALFSGALPPFTRARNTAHSGEAGLRGGARGYLGPRAHRRLAR
eukprot:2161701-Rhodomonas_salina.1